LRQVWVCWPAWEMFSVWQVTLMASRSWQIFNREIWGSHSGVFEDSSLLGC
jgi:hypothetical protein